MTAYIRYAPVDAFELLTDGSADGRVTGLASPAAGPKPCGVALMSGTRALAEAAAIDFADQAQARHLRHGWCGFAIGGLHQALALGNDAHLQCVASGRVLSRWSVASLARSLAPNARVPAGVQDVLARVRRVGACTDPEQVLPFALDLAHRGNGDAVVEATFLYLLGRAPGPVGLSDFRDDYTAADRHRQLWRTIGDTPERQMRLSIALPGPFNAGFRFPTTIFG